MTAPQAALEQVLAAAGLNPALAAAVTITGADPVLPSGFLLGTAGAASLGAVGLAAADLWRRRGGGAQTVAIDLRAAALALRTERHVLVDDAAPESPWSPISGFYQAGDGRWVQFHCNFPPHRDGILAVLGAANDRADVAAKVAGWTAQALEDRLAAAGMCAAMLRSGEEWQAHPQGRAVAVMPLVEIVRIGDAPRRSVDHRGAGNRPLAGIRVLDLSRVIAGPVAGRTLAEHGATVMRISAPHLPFVAPLLLDTGHGKVNAEIDLDAPGGRDRLHGLLADADVMIDAYRPDALAGRGFGAAELARRHPGIVLVRLSAYGEAGPWGARRGFDTLVQTASGLAADEAGGGIHDRPHHLPAQALDYATAYLAAFGTMVALARRADEGGSWCVRLSLAATARWLDALGRVPDRAAAFAIPDPARDAGADLMIETASPFGRLRHLKPALRMSATPPRWDRPPSPLASHPAEWPAA
ncbi:CoA transferase family III [Stella humosa]|uniref:CoA transferase family III n=1 Tax=Stella humosa TaxID=94 RepID=A0A3N1LQ56_9PROT|nr:CoA transferase [Stella humosa]ROP91325.1 CoA transferase family III [Stella humosa]